MKVAELLEAQITAQDAWVNLLMALDDLGDDEDLTLTKKHKDDKKGIELIKAVMGEGINFDKKTAMHWAIDTVGSFEVTHKNYKEPAGSNTKAAKQLQNRVMDLLGLGDEYQHKIDEAVSEKKFRLEDSDQKHYGGVQFELKGRMPAEVKKAAKNFDIDHFTQDGFTTINVSLKEKAKFKKMLVDLGYTQVKHWGLTESHTETHPWAAKMLEVVKKVSPKVAREITGIEGSEGTETPKATGKKIIDAFKEAGYKPRETESDLWNIPALRQNGVGLSVDSRADMDLTPGKCLVIFYDESM